jgi:hypothetical protein
MKKQKDLGKTRRKFLSLSLLGGAGMLVGKAVDAQTPAESSETVKMLTPDGKLVEVDKKAFVTINKNASNQDVLNWMSPNKDLEKK